LSCQHNDNVLHEENIIGYVSDENICWLDPHNIIAAATADVVLAV